MARNSKIEWTNDTWNVITGCTLVDSGCKYCYAAQLAATRLKNHDSRKGLARKNAKGTAQFTGEVRFNRQWLDQPLKAQKPRMYFVCAHGDLFHPDVPDDWIDQIFSVIVQRPQHTFQILTKRPDRAAEYLGELATCPVEWRTKRFNYHPAPTWPLRNVWLGTSISDQASADCRVPALLSAPARLHFVSAEPMLGPIRLDRIEEHVDTFEDCGGHPDTSVPLATHDATWLNALVGKYDCEHRNPDGTPMASDFMDVGILHTGGKIDWVICGGESGKEARPMHPDWARSLRDQCQASGTPFLFKQAGEWTAWQFDSPPLLRNAYTGFLVDRHVFIPADTDKDPTWNDGLTYVHEGHSHVMFQRAGKKAAGRLLDGIEHNAFPNSPAEQKGGERCRLKRR